MDAKTAALKSRLYLACAAVLIVGLAAASLIYATVDEAPESAVSYVIVDGVAHPVDIRTSKAYVRDLQRFGGRAAVLFDDFNHWFAGLWRGKALATTVAWLSFVVSALLWLAASLLPLRSRRGG